MLYTLENYRGRGYAQLVMSTLMDAMLAQGLAPISGVQVKNFASSVFHEKLGMELSHCADIISYQPTQF